MSARTATVVLLGKGICAPPCPFKGLTFSLDIPVLQINRRGMYTPLNDLCFDPMSARLMVSVLAAQESVLRFLAL